jgi:DNA polymerase-3 subunit delta'
MSFATLIGNERNKEILRRLLQRGRLAAPLIFAGPEGVGKRQFALTLAKAANCQRVAADTPRRYAEDSCDECAACRRIGAGAYGDVTEIKPDGAYIKIAQARTLAEEVYFRPREGRQRFFLIDEADRLREEAANALLKTLEEPPETSTIILLTARPDALLLTIRSRAQRLNFAPLAVAEMERYLAANYRRPAPDTALLARITGGRIGQATAIDISDYRRERRELLEIIELLAAGDNRYRLLKAAEYLGKLEREGFERKLEMLTALLRDIFWLAAGGPPQSLVNLDVADRLELLAQRLSLRRLTAWAEKLDELRANLRLNINRQVATEALFLSTSQMKQARSISE